jgi:hypothetical protein
MKKGDTDTLQRFGLVSEAEVAALLGITVESLRHRSLDQLPAFFKSGRRKLFREEAVREFIERNTKSAA